MMVVNKKGGGSELKRSAKVVIKNYDDGSE